MFETSKGLSRSPPGSIAPDDNGSRFPNFYLTASIPENGSGSNIRSARRGNISPQQPIEKINESEYSNTSSRCREEIGIILGLHSTKVDRPQAKRDQLQDLFRTLLHELMTAKTRVHELELGKEAVA